MFQRPSDNFLPNLTIGEHLRLASGQSGGERDTEILERLGIGHRIDHLPDELSGGEQQRAAFAQAVVAGSAVVVADEPTAELDTESGRLVMDGVRTLVDAGVTFVVATHDRAVRRLRRRGRGARPRPTEGNASRGSGRPQRRAARYYGGERLPSEYAEAAISVDGLSKVFHHHGGDVVHALESVSFEARPGELVGLVGRSGSGKTTLLNVIAGWERPTEGEVRWRDPWMPGSPAWSAVAVVPAEARA